MTAIDRARQTVLYLSMNAELKRLLESIERQTSRLAHRTDCDGWHDAPCDRAGLRADLAALHADVETGFAILSEQIEDALRITRTDKNVN